jgi:trehalose synthase-fused probable maltokinase
VTDVPGAVGAGDLGFLDEDALREWILRQRWFGSKAREVAQLHVLDALPLRTDQPLLVAAMVEARFHPGTHVVYQILLGLRPRDEGWDDGVVTEAEGWTVYDALADPVHAREVLHLMRGSRDVRSGEAGAAFRWAEGFDTEGAEAADVRPMGAEQSNSSIVFGDALVLKAFRRLEPGINPELELLRFLSARDFQHVAALAGWYQYSGPLMDATLGILQEFLTGGRDGWEFALDELASEPEDFLARIRELGGVTGEMHAALGSDPSDPDFAPEQPSSESLHLLTATVDEEIERVFLDLPDAPALAPIAGRGEDVREHLRAMSGIGVAGRVIRHHGDFHLGQTMLTDRGWIILDFEGEPARSLRERRLKRSPLRDVAGMMRSFAYVASAAGILRGVTAPAGWEARARDEFLAGYLERVDPALLPPGQEAVKRLLAVFELEKAVYELEYELNNRPDWVGIPVAGIVRLLDGEAP